jgi:uncharacterized repeat protein (TIGR03803 family)
MRSERVAIGPSLILAIIAALFALGSRAAAQTETVLHSFGGGRDATQVNGGLAFDAAGNLYGTATGGGSYNNGAVFQLSPQSDGDWTETLIYSFAKPSDGILPNAGVTIDAAGDLYGTTTTGGTYNHGTAYILSPTADGVWIEKTLYSFTPKDVGSDSISILPVLDAAGRVYGTNYTGGDYGYGEAFQLSPNADGVWSETILRSFSLKDSDGFYPSGLVFDSAGNLYGSTFEGGAFGGGTVFELSPTTRGGWTETILYSFDIKNRTGAYGPGDIKIDSAGNIYGLSLGGAYGIGAVFELTRGADGAWTEKVLYSFSPRADGYGVASGWVVDAAGNIYGTTEQGGRHRLGSVFELMPQGGVWTEKILYSFNNDSADGILPFGDQILDATGNLYGTTGDGGLYGGGVVFRVTP